MKGLAGKKGELSSCRRYQPSKKDYKLSCSANAQWKSLSVGDSDLVWTHIRARIKPFLLGCIFYQSKQEPDWLLSMILGVFVQQCWRKVEHMDGKS